MVVPSMVVNLTLAAQNDAGMGQHVFCEKTCKSNTKSSKSIQLLAAAPRAAGAGPLRRALGRRAGGGRAAGRALLGPVQVAAPRDVWGRGHPAAQVRRGAEGPRRKGAAEARLVPGPTPVAQAVEPVRAPRMHRAQGQDKASPPRSPPPPGPHSLSSAAAAPGQPDTRKSRRQPGRAGST